MTDLLQSFRGSVNRWECDENDHLNVRFYAHKMYQTLQAGLVECGAIAPDDINVTEKILSVHMRYIAEARIAAPISGFTGVIAQTANGLSVVTELRHTANGTLLASYLFELSLTSPATLKTVPMPEGAGSRGLPAACSEFAGISLADAEQQKFVKTGQGVVQPEECDLSGQLLFYQYIGRVSDAVPNLWPILEQGSTRGEGMLGGAVLEYRTDKLGTLNLGEPFVLLSGFKGFGDKTKHLVHLLFNQRTRQCVAASEAIAINMDLVARKAVAIPVEQRELLEQLLITPLD